MYWSASEGDDGDGGGAEVVKCVGGQSIRQNGDYIEVTVLVLRLGYIIF
jgi:hypothetical protein